MKISLGQFAPDSSVHNNLERIEAAVVQAASEGSALIVFPEMAMFYQKEFDPTFLRAAESIPGPFTAAIDSLARQHNIAIVGGMLESTETDNRAYNTVYATSSDGHQLAAYRKVHLFDAFGIRESNLICPGGTDGPVTFELGEYRVGIITCYDVRFPESARRLVDAGASVLLIPAAWTPGPYKEYHWGTLTRARAIENTVYVIAPNQATPLSTGRSIAVDPMGVVLAELGEGAEMATVSVEKKRIDQVRRINPAVSNRRYRVLPTLPEAGPANA